ncbi:FAD-dependent monooxygenase [Microbispora sp. H10949]|uniref:FAD-dependent monooxygenase n=1 Tax=Microbispora sp. H10949 TaxID=2729111 RepID=UPI0016027603|nr:FAD-dependent monooxygenase [Microbispora sp. H10949]
MGGSPRPKAVVVGAGIGGLAAAVTLRRIGMEVEVYERAGELRAAGSALSIMSNAIRALGSLGIDLGLEERGQVIEHVEMMTTAGRTLRVLPYKENCAKLGAPSVCISRSELQAALLEAAGDCPISLGAVATGFSAGPDGVRVRFADGREAHGDLLIGADGIHSAIRRQLTGPEPVREAGYVCWLAVTRFAHPRLTRGFNGHYWGKGQRFGLHDIGHGNAYWWGTRNMTPEAAREWNGTKADILRAYQGWAEEVTAAIEATEPEAVIPVPAQDRPFLERWGEGPVTLLGDAAHPMMTSLVQGGSSAVEDAVVLAQACAGSGDPVRALRAYEDRRRAHIRWLVERSYAMSAIEQEERPVPRLIRDAFMRFAPKSVLFKPFETSMSADLPTRASVPAGAGR